MLQLIEPNISHKEQWEEIMTEWDNERKMPWIFFLDSYDQVLKKIESIKYQDDLVNQIAQSSVFFLIDDITHRVLWFYWFRHNLQYWNDHEIGWHLGYGIRPSERKKWFASKWLHLLLEEIKKLWFSEIFVTCDDDNIWSWKVIENNWGTLQKMILRKWVAGRRYLIQLK